MSDLPHNQDMALLAQSLDPADFAPAVVKPKRRASHKHERKFAATMTVRTHDGGKFRVAVTPEAAQAQRQLLAARLMDVFQKNVKFMSDNEISLAPQQLKDFFKAGETVSAMVEAAYKGLPQPEASSGHSSIGKIAQQMMHGAMQGAMQGAQMTMEERLAKIASLGRQQKTEIVVSGEKMEKLVEKPHD